jgi:hypothetical protein
MPDLATDDVRTDDDWEPAIDDDAPPPRSRRRLVTPLTVGLCGVLIAAAGFIAGVQVQKGSQTGSGNGNAGGGGAAGLRAGFGGGGGGAAPGAAGTAGSGAQAQDAPTFGTVANKKGATLYVKDADGTTLRVKTNAQSKVTRNAAASPKGIYPGDTVVVQGTKDKSGNLVATQITATSKTAAAAGGGGFGGGGGLRRQFATPPGG